MRKQKIIYIAVDHKDADCFLTELFDKIHNETSIIQFNKKTLILETETCIAGTFIINSPHRTKTLRGAASYFCKATNRLRRKLVELINYMILCTIENYGLELMRKKLQKNSSLKYYCTEI